MKLYLKRSHGVIELDTSVKAKKAIEELRIYYRLDPKYKDLPSVIDRLMDVLTIFEDENKPFNFRVFCPLCEWISNEMRESGGNPTIRGKFINTVCRVLGNHLKSKHGFYDSKRYSYMGQSITVFKCKRCDFEAVKLWDILAHYVSEHEVK